MNTSLNALVNSARQQIAAEQYDDDDNDDMVTDRWCDGSGSPTRAGAGTGTGTGTSSGSGIHRRQSFMYSDTTDTKFKTYNSTVRCYSVSKTRQTLGASTIARCNTYTPKSRSAAAAVAAANRNTAGIRRPLRSSFNIPRGDNLLVTPFAQVLASLRSVRNSYMMLTNAQSNRTARAQQPNGQQTSSSSCLPKPEFLARLNEDTYQRIAVETLDELEWCLEQLEALQAHRSVSELTTSKFKRLLSKELSHFAEQTRSGPQISEYICSTFLDKRNDVDLSSPETGGSEAANNSNANANVNANAHANSSSNSNSKSSGGARQPAKSQKSIAYSDTNSVFTNSSGNPVTSRNEAGREENIMQLIAITQAAVRDIKVIAGSREKSLRLNPPRTVPEEAMQSLQSASSVPIVASTNSSATEALYHEELQALIIESLDKWGIDIFKITELSGGRPLTVMTYTILEKRDLIRTFKLDSRRLINYIMVIEENYHADVPYHNCTHAADVTQSVHVLLSLPAFENVFTDVEILACVIAAAIHDVDHPGFTNQFLINTGSELAIMYNDESVLENHHLAVGFKIMQMQDLDPFNNLDSKRRQNLRKMIIDMVRATDMQKHMSLLADLRTMVETKKVANNGVLVLDNYTDRIQILQNMIHCADLSNPGKPLYLYQEWVRRISEEFFRQGDREIELEVSVSPMCDRSTANVEKSQVSFIDFIVQPLWETWADLVLPDCQCILEQLEENRDWYQQQINQAIDKLPQDQEQEQEQEQENNHN